MVRNGWTAVLAVCVNHHFLQMFLWLIMVQLMEQLNIYVRSFLKCSFIVPEKISVLARQII